MSISHIAVSGDGTYGRVFIDLFMHNFLLIIFKSFIDIFMDGVFRQGFIAIFMNWVLFIFLLTEFY